MPKLLRRLSALFLVSILSCMIQLLRVVLASIAICIISISSFAQPKKMIADKIVGKVGDRIILYSDIQNAINDAIRQGAQLPPNPECILLEGELIKKALVIQAEKDSLPVSDEEIDALLDNQVRGMIQQYGGDKTIIEQITGKSVYQLKEDSKQAFKEKKLAESMRSKIVDNVKITPNEVRDYFNGLTKDSLPYYESELQVGQLTLYPKASRDIESYTAKQLNDIKRQIETGGRRFDQMAKLYTQDPGSKENGGQYNINRNDKFWDPVFISTAFKLKEGQISNVVKSKFGLHIIQLVSRFGDDAVVRHILMIPQVTDDEMSDATHKLDSIKNLLDSKKMSFGEAVAKFSEDDDSKFTGGMKQSRDGNTLITIDQLDKDIIPMLKNMKPGQFSAPQSFASEQGKKGVRILYLLSRSEPHRMNIRDDYNRIATQALEEKKQSILEKWFSSHISNYYIYIDPEYQSCQQLSVWEKQALLSKQ